MKTPPSTTTTATLPSASIYLPAEWASLLAHDIAHARHRVILTALSAQPPRHSAKSPHGALWQELCAAPSRGLSVTLLIAAPMNAHPATSRALHAARYLHGFGVTVLLVPGPRLLHQKTVCLDREVCWVGSGNFTAAAANHNYELYARMKDAGACLQVFNRAAEIAAHAGATLGNW